MRELTGVLAGLGLVLATVGLCHLFAVREGDCTAVTLPAAAGYLLHSCQERLDNLEPPIFLLRSDRKEILNCITGRDSAGELKFSREIR